MSEHARAQEDIKHSRTLMFGNAGIINKNDIFWVRSLTMLKVLPACEALRRLCVAWLTFSFR